jgi:hypothetical protein
MSFTISYKYAGFLSIFAHILVTEELVSKTFANLATFPFLFKTILWQINFEAP